LPRGLGRSQWDTSSKKQVQNRRRFMLLGQTLAGMQVWDVRRALAALRAIPACGDISHVELHGQSDMAEVALYASLFEPAGLSLVLQSPRRGNDRTDFLNVLRYLDMPQVAALAAGNGRRIEIRQPEESGDYDFANAVVKQLGTGSIVIRP
jgi:hypothetical protein